MLARLALALLVAALCFTTGRAILKERLATAAPAKLALPPLPEEGRQDLTLLLVEGDVERIRPEGGASPALRGVPLEEGERLHVEGGARAALRLGVGSSLTLEPGSEITALSVAGGEIALLLDSGRARVDLTYPARVLRVRSPEGGEAVARGPGARFLIAAHPGRLSLMNEADGAPVRLLAGGEEVEVPPGRVSWSVHGGAPRPPIEPPREPGLEIAGATLALEEPRSSDDESKSEGSEEGVAAPEVVIRGRAHPLALVRIGPTFVDVAADGSFEARLLRQEEPYAVLASLPTGREALLEVRSPPLALETPPEESEPPRQRPVERKKRKRTAPKGKAPRARR